MRTEKQQLVFDAALQQLKSKKWFKGVCVDNFPTDEEISKDFNKAVEKVIDETAFWDDY